MNGSSLRTDPLPLIHARANEQSDKRRRSEYHLGTVGLSLIDAALALVTFQLACWLSPAYHAWGGSAAADPHFSPLKTAVLYAMLLPIVAHVFGLHNPLLPRQRLPLLVKYACSAGIALVLLTLAELVIFYARIGRHILVFGFLLSTMGVTVLRLLLWRMSEERKRKVVVLGSTTLSRRVLDLIRATGVPYEVVPVEKVACVVSRTSGDSNVHLDCMGGSLGYCRQCGIDEIVVCGSVQTPGQELRGLVHSLLSGVQVSDYASFMERTFFKVPVDQIGAEWFYQLNSSGDYAIYLAAKRIADITCAAVGLVVTAPLVAVAALLIRIESAGPVFYSQVRTGRYNQPFRIWKLRSMRIDAERDGPQWASRNDRRVTRIGRVLRLCRLDEVPQFLNVIRGEMSLVGPRPERPEMVEELARDLPFYQHRHLLKPGITGWAQINYPYGATKEDALNKLKYDLYYIKYASLMLDIQIVLRTIGTVMKGAR